MTQNSQFPSAEEMWKKTQEIRRQQCEADEERLREIAEKMMKIILGKIEKRINEGADDLIIPHMEMLCPGTGIRDLPNNRQARIRDIIQAHLQQRNYTIELKGSALYIKIIWRQ